MTEVPDKEDMNIVKTMDPTKKEILYSEPDEHQRLRDTTNNKTVFDEVMNGRYCFPGYNFSLSGGQLINPHTGIGIGKNAKLKYDGFYKKASGSYIDSENHTVIFEIELTSKESDMFPKYIYSVLESDLVRPCEIEIVSADGKTEIEIKNHHNPLIFLFDSDLPETK